MASTIVSNEANFIIVYGICRPQRGYNPLNRLLITLVDSDYLVVHCRRNSPARAFLADNSGNATKSALDIGRNSSLHTHLDGLKGAESHICNELCRCTSRQIERSLPSSSSFFSNQIAIKLLEVFVSSVFECTLGLCGSSLSALLFCLFYFIFFFFFFFIF